LTSGQELLNDQQQLSVAFYSGMLQVFDAQDFVKVRGSTEGQQAFMVWTGFIYSFVPQESRQRLFKIVGMSVARCLPREEGWDFTSRELTYYLDPETGEILQQWQNPWTQETVAVMHVANSPVQGQFQGRRFPGQVLGEFTTFTFDLFLNYPNPLAADPKFQAYSPHPTYQAAELFKLTVPTADLENPGCSTVSSLMLSWDRIGPWLPWMKMGSRPGQLVYSACGHKVADVAALPELLQTEITTRLPLYRQAPEHKLEQEDMTSWLYFQQHFDAYLRGEIFPLPEPATREPD